MGDVHGCSAELQDLLEKFAFVPGKDKLISVGDVINKGPDVLGALRILKDLDAQVVLGNHEAGFLKIWQLPPWQRRPKDNERLAAYRNLGEIADYIKDWPLWIELPQMPLPQGLTDITVVHAGLEPGKVNIADMNPHCLVSIRTWDGIGTNLKNPKNPPWHQCAQWSGIVVFGHWAVQGLYLTPKLRGLDTGCVYGRKLSAWSVEEDKVYQVNSRQTKRIFD